MKTKVFLTALFLMKIGTSLLFAQTSGNDPSPYCWTNHLYGCIIGEEISDFYFNTIANTNSGCANYQYSAAGFLGYENTGISTTVNPGQSFPFYAYLGATNPSGLAIFIDFNFDYDFADAGENVYNTSTPAWSHSGNITIPTNNAYGTTRMRVISGSGVMNSSNTLSNDGCGDIANYGETEDYIINIVDPVCAVSYGGYSCNYNCYIDNFTFNTISEYGTGCSPGDDYVLSSSTTTVYEGQVISFLTQYGPSPQMVAIYFDINQDNDFADSGEMVYVNMGLAYGHSGSITIPMGTTAGAHRMRVISGYDNLSFPSDGCGYINDLGETQDYIVNVLANPAYPYCPPSYTVDCSSYAPSYISNFTFNTINESSGCSNNISLSTATTTVYAGQTYNFTTTYNGVGMLAIYIDFNQDYDFSDSGELVFSNVTQAFGHSGSFTIPSILTSTYRMRVMQTYSLDANVFSFPSDGCGYVGMYGETQDYNINVIKQRRRYDYFLCSRASTYMNAELPSGYTGLWTNIDGAGTIITPTSPTTQIKNLTIGSSGTFLWNITNGIDSLVDTFIINRAGAPTNVSVTNVTPTTATFEWNSTVDTDSFSVRITENCTVSGAGQNFKVPGNVRSWTATGLKGCTNYCVKLRSQCSANSNSAFSAPASFNTTGPVACKVVNGYTVSGVQGCTYNVSWANGCVTADSFRVRYRSGTNPFVSSPFTTGNNINLNLGVGTWEIRIQTWCNGVAVGLSPAGSYYTISNCSLPYAVSLSQNSGCNYKIAWENCGTSDSFRVRYRTGANAYANSPFTINNFINLNLAPGSWDFRIQNWCGNAVAGLTNPYNFNIASCRIAGIQENVSNLVLFPNPTSDKSLLNFTSEVDGDYSLIITDLSGRILRTSNGTAVTGENTTEILVDGYAKGVYFVGLTLNGETRQIKLTVQ